MLKETAFSPCGIIYSQTADGGVKGPFKIGGIQKESRSGEHPFESMHASAFKTKALKSRGVLNGRPSQFAVTAGSFQGPPTVKPAGAIGGALETLDSKAFE
eukprot:gb/GFBE01006689.1/.p1 GENE.gb/GFBE01006689.1/~~gb/GFBE01006689.1/.p1  ORF type:complete len:101 (+),score=28.17 gb/GFBE01006689.1/:1-303(+)